ncbi:major facilitator superfamily domain-containing protein 12-like [Oppia nitens]|uniref:major facilitator superfamily domain-containing protein 12-like n=1 Tax=Oppia nitens TaxID=1686743 RepID=UPI0023DA277A|nr:major facilitator superfamily domain-containing protein 12-like [Oppia nitens]XP_054159275.1 major facilitator superfamily domain-containing protein 12-like [Oppia nitens]
MAEEDDAMISLSESTNRHFLPLRQRLAFCVGHVLNDVCAAIWFSYFLVYMHFINRFHKTAAYLLLIGQIADAIATPFVGIELDKDNDWWICRYGRKKCWHLLGTVLICVTFPIIFTKCIGCDSTSENAKMVYYSAFIVIFQFGWAAVQISHLSLIPDLTPYSSERVELNAWRYALSVASNITVYLIAWLMFYLDGRHKADSDQITPNDDFIFRDIILIVMSIGVVLSLIFHFGVKEAPQMSIVTNIRNSRDNLMTLDLPSIETHLKWKHWFKESQFYKVGLLYTGTRLYVNLIQVYVPLFLQETLKLKKDSIAYIPLVIYSSGFISSFLMKYINTKIGKKLTYFIGNSISLSASIWLYFGTYDSFKKYDIYGVTVLMGISGSTMLITSLSITNDMIGHNTSSGAFVFGAMSFMDKLSNGIAVIVIENLHPCKTCGCSVCDNYYRNILAFVCGGATILTLIALALLAPHPIGVSRNNQLFTTSNTINNDEEIESDDEDLDNCFDNSVSPLISNNRDININ